MGLKCILRHRYGLPHLDGDGLVRFECMQCGRLAVSPARLTPDDAEAAAQRDRLARAIATLGAGWVGRASNDHPEAKFRALRAAPKAPRRRRSESDRAA